MEREFAGSAIVVRASGAVDMSTVDELVLHLGAALESAVREAAPVVAVDLEGVTYFGSAGLNAVLRCHERGMAAGIGVRLVATNPWVVRPLEVTGLDTVLRLYRSLPEALGPDDAAAQS
ncbi:STAS domain-containing protein [Nocardia sp. NPDC020380]|uniref:STAS domain-containing protein n=1 Tax=Nocardia sp. NPDC020380 TaxID=3364309 RepID=UPI0037A419AE